MTHDLLDKPADILGKITVYLKRDDTDKKGERPAIGKLSKKQTGGSLSNNVKDYFTKLKRHPELKSYRLSNRDIIVIAAFWQSYIEKNDLEMSWSEICEKASMDTYKLSVCMNYLDKLLAKRIISIKVKRFSDDELTSIKLMNNRLMLEPLFLTRLLGYNIITECEKNIRDTWNSNNDFLEDIKKVLKILSRFIDPDIDYLDRINNKEVDFLFSATKLLYKKLKKSNDCLTFAKALNTYKLSHVEFTILILIAYQELFAGFTFEKQQILNLISRNYDEYLKYSSYLAPHSKLIVKPLAEIETEKLDPQIEYYKLHKDFKNELKNEDMENHKALNKSQDMLTSTINDIQSLSVIKTSQTIDELILPKDCKQTLKVLVSKYKDNATNTLSHWGFGNEPSYNDGRHKGLIAIFYGISGTGKTFAAGAIANELGKLLASVNCWDLRQSYYGATEKKVKQIFMEMRKIIEEYENPPVFLINEADQIIHSRKENAINTDFTENSIQNIMLEEMESFPGILILTTNLIKIIDEAYYRRFNMKLEFPLPDVECRKKLWQLHLLKNIPGADRIDVEYMAESYPFTGGQISLVIQNACNEAITRSGDRRQLTMHDLIKYAKLEMPFQPFARVKNIGFSISSKTTS